MRGINLHLIILLASQLCLTCFNSMDCSLLGSTVHGILQAIILEWVAIPFSRDLPDPWIELVSLASPALAGRFFTTATPGNPIDYTDHCGKARHCDTSWGGSLGADLETSYHTHGHS